MQEPQCLVFRLFRLDLCDERLWRGHEATPLSPKTFAVLCCLVTQAGQLVTKDALLEAVWPATVMSEAAPEVESALTRSAALCQQMGEPPQRFAVLWGLCSFHITRAEHQQALAVARRQQAKAWELRAATSLSRLWQHQGKRAAAYDLLAPVYGWFTEGFDTADLQEAKTLLEALEE